jgi:hypothetical protein
VVIKGFAVTATVIVTGPEEVEPPDDPDDEHAASASNPVVAIAGSAIILLRLFRRMSTVLLLEIVPGGTVRLNFAMRLRSAAAEVTLAASPDRTSLSELCADRPLVSIGPDGFRGYDLISGTFPADSPVGRLSAPVNLFPCCY